jgi:threonine dehydrogenase-like Zn-dependent dehydrogenase
MKAAVLTEYGRFEWREVPAPHISDSQVLVKVNHSSICGSDMHIFRGEFHPRTKVPFIPGHEFAGTVYETGQNVTQYRRGDRVAVDPIIWCGECAACKLGHYPACTSLKLLGVDVNGGFAEYVAVEERMLYKLKSNIDDINAALTEVYSIGFHACRRAGIKAQDTIAIWGAGRIGQCILQAARTQSDNTIFFIDILNGRLNLPLSTYKNIVTINIKVEDPADVIREATGGRGVDIAFEAVGHAVKIQKRMNPIQGCIQCIRGAGTICVLGLTIEPSPIFMRDLIWKEAKIVASRVSQGEFKQVIEHMSLGDLHPEILISKEMHPENIQEAFQLLDGQPDRYLKILLKMT